MSCTSDPEPLSTVLFVRKKPMNRPAGMSFVRSFAVVCLVLAATSLASAQITNVDDTTSTPIEGAGHDYIKALSETVNPANGSLSLRIEVPVAKGRGLTIPFSFGYDSNAARHLKPGFYPNYGTAYWVSNTGYTGQGGWIYTVPQLNLTNWTSSISVLTGVNNGVPIYSLEYCNYAAAYTFRDGSGGVHSLGLATRWYPDTNGAPQYCRYNSVATGGDPQVGAAFTRRQDGQTSGDFYLPGFVNVYEPDGTVYYFSSSAPGGGDDNTVYLLPTYIEDRNGNKVTVSGNSFTDTLGRPLLSYTGLGPAGQTNTVSVSGLNYQVTWKAVSASFVVASSQANATNPAIWCSPIPTVSDTQTVVSRITLPNGQAYNFYYGNDVTPHNAATNSFGLLSEIDYPSGGWVQYTWKPSDTMNELADYPGLINGDCGPHYPNNCPTPSIDGCLYQYKTPVVSSRVVSFGGSTAALTQTFVYATNWNNAQNGNLLGTSWSSKTTSVTTTDNTVGKASLTQYTYGFVQAPLQPFDYSTQGNQVPVESTTEYYDWGNTSKLRTVTKTWYDQYDLASESITEGGKASKTTYCYVGTNCAPAAVFAQLQEKDDYDFGASTPTRQTVTTYQSLSGTPGVIADKACSVVVCPGGSSCSTSSPNKIAETDYYYDGGTTSCGPLSPSTAQPVAYSATVVAGTHDDDNTLGFGPSSTVPRGNLTKKVSWASTGASPTKTYAYDTTGQVRSITDPCGNTTCADMTGSTHTTSFSYTDAFTVLSGGSNVAYNPTGGATNAYLTQVTDPLLHISSFTYDYYSGELTKSTDPNLQNTTYLYNDAFARPTQATFPDGGQTEIAYKDTYPPSVTTCQLISGTAGATCSPTAPPTGWKTSVAVMDGMMHVTQTQLASDPENPTYVDTTYDGSGRVRTQSNPHRSAASPTDGTTTYAYDALGRTTTVTQPDGSAVTTTYDQTNPKNSGLCTTVTDEAGKARQSCADGLGRMTAVWEDPGTSPHLNYETDYAYDPLNNLTCAVQKGTDTTAFTTCGAASATWRPRSFVYDSLSRLTSSTNPESGTITYQYDANSNLSTRIAPRPGQTSTATVTTNYSYDVENRLTQKAYTGLSTAVAKYLYDGTGTITCNISQPSITSPTNLVHRMAASCSGQSASKYSYDPMGRLLAEARNNKGSGNPIKYTPQYTYYKDGSLKTLLYPSGKTLTYLVGGAGRVTKVSDSDNNVFAQSITYAPQGALTGMTGGTSGTGIVTQNIYNNRLQPTLLSAKQSGQSNSFFSLCYDFHSGVAINSPPCVFSAYGTGNNGNVFQAIDNNDSTRSATFTYDQLNRITQANTVTTTGSNCWGETYTLDAWGNLTNIAGVSTMGSCWHETLTGNPASNQNQLANYCYDAAGNLVQNSACPLVTPIYTYDAENRLNTTAGYTYYYDANGERIEKSNGTSGTMYWSGPGGEYLTETDLTGSTINEEYIYLDGERIARVDRPSGTAHYYFSDKLNSASTITDPAGSVQERYYYYPYGGLVTSIGSDSNHYKFTGKERDAESGLDNFEARYYGSSLGRFTSPDPEQIDGFDHLSDPQSWNGYAYVHNNPLNATDPDGLDCIYVNNDTGAYDHTERGDCDNSTEERANSGYYVNGTVNTVNVNDQGQITGFSGTGENGNLISGAFAPTPLDTSGQLNPTAQAIFSQPVFGYAAGTVDLAARIEYRTASFFFFPITGLLIDQVTGIDSGSGVSAAGISRKPGTLGMRGGTDALRRENKIARDIMKELKLGKEARVAVKDALRAGAEEAGRALTYKEGLQVVREALGLL